MKLLIAVKSCAQAISEGHNHAIRETWGRCMMATGAAHMMFFVGHGTINLAFDELRLDAPDSYYGLPQKTRAILRFALKAEYDFVYLCDTDSFVIPKRLLASGFENFDLYGFFGHRQAGVQTSEGWAWPSGGGGYWLSAKAAKIIADVKEFDDWAEDRMVGRILGPYIQRGELKARNDNNYAGPNSEPTMITAHYCAHGLHRVYDPRWMRTLFEKYRSHM